MDLHLNPFEPNLKLLLGLKEDLKTKYYEKHERAKQTLESFSCCLRKAFHEYQKLLTDNIELDITVEKLKQTIDKNEVSQQKVSVLNEKQCSNTLGASKNTNLNAQPKISDVDKKVGNKIFNEGKIPQKENILEFVPIFSSDFNSDIEDESFEKLKSPPPSVVCTPVKVHSSPILSKRKRFSSKKNNSSISNTSNTSSPSAHSSNDSKISLINIAQVNETFSNGINTESIKEPEKEPLKTIENIYLSTTPTTHEKNKSYKVLEVSKTNYGKTEFIDKGKRLRQTTLTLKKVAPLIDISKADTNETINNTQDDIKAKMDSAWNETFFNNEFVFEETKEIKQSHNQNKNLREVDTEKEVYKVKSDSKNAPRKTITENQNTSAKDDELIETSPAQNEKSKLRNKLSLNKKLEVDKIKVKTPSSINSNTVSNLKCTQNDTTQFEDKYKNKKSESKHQHKSVLESINKITKSTSFKGNQFKSSSNVTPEKRKSLELQRTFSDDTYFSPAEMNTNKYDYEVDLTGFEDEMKHDTPPAKRMLLNSFDVIPGRKGKSTEYAYKEAPVRNKNERAQLPGWGCRDCEKWYGHLPEEEREKRKNQCSKHRGKYKADILTPESFWNPVFNDTNDSSSFGD